MFQKSKISMAVALTVASLASAGALAQDAQRVEITGSAVRRIDAESALPVLVIKAEDIARSGATSTVDLLRRLPSVQGSTGESASVGGTTFGFSGISIHNIGETRTLVLLNGHRLSLFGGQTLTGFAAGFDLNAIPVSAIERIEILTDGASALYGADAIAGVVNFITKRNGKEGDLTIGVSEPKDGAKEKRVSLTKGFGSLEADNFNLMLSFAHDERTKLDSTKRDFAKSGRVFFGKDGKNYRFQQFSPSPIPANALDDSGQLISPYQKKTGACPPKTFRVIEPATDGSGLVDDYCGFDFVGELEIYPVRERDSGFASLSTKLGDHELRADLLMSQSKQTSRIAPVPGSISIPAGSPLHDKYLLPLGITQDSRAFYRVYDLGKRTNNDQADFVDLSLSARGLLLGFDYEGGYTHSESKVKSNIAGYPGALALSALRSSGLLDPFVLPGQQTAAGAAALAKTAYNGYWDGGTSKLDSLSLRGSREIMALPDGTIQLAAGVNFNRENFKTNPSLFAQGKLADPVAGTLCGGAIKCDQRFGDASAKPPYGASRNSYGVFGELVIPVTKTLEANLAVRHDNFDGFGSADTAKASLKWAPSKTWLVRGSVGTGFHAPTVPQVSSPTQPYGVTSDKYTCTADLKAVAVSLGAVCQSGNRQYDQVAGGNSSLKPEKSLQGTLGLRFEPIRELSMGADLWHVGINNAFGQITEQTVFKSPKQYTGSFTTATDVGTGTKYIAFLADNKNLGNYFATGIDFDATARFAIPIGDVTSQLNVTYMLREDQQLLKNGAYYSAIGVNSADLGIITFRYQGKWNTSLRTGDWVHTLGVNFKSGFTDKETPVDVLDANGNVTATEMIKLKADVFTTVDLQTRWEVLKNLSLNLGVLDVFNQRPPLTLSTGGTNKGQQFGYDDRYYDSRGRTYYGNLTLKF